MQSKCCNFETIPPEKDEDNNSNWRAQSCYICKKCEKACEVMADYLDIQFQWYKNGIKTIRPSGNITLGQLINSIISPKPEMIEAFELIKKAGEAKNKEEKDKLKAEKLFFTTPSAIFNPIRNYASIQKFLPLAIFEYDDIPDASILRDYIFEKRKDCIFAFNSPSATGTKFIFLLGETPTSVQHYKELWFGIAHDLDKFRNLDLSNERCTQPLYNSYDPNAKLRLDAVGSSVRGYKTSAFVPFVGEIDIPEDVSEEDKEECFKLITHLIDRIVDSGHNQVISTSFLSSGIAVFYGIDTNEMWDLLEGRIRNNTYLSKGVNGYLTSAKTMFNKGLVNPTALKRDEK